MSSVRSRQVAPFLMHQTHRYIYTAEAEPQYKRVLGEMHDRYNTHLIACGTDRIGVNIQTVKMSRLGHDMKYCQRVVGAMLRQKPSVHSVLLSDDDQKSFECVIGGVITYAHKEKIPLIQGWFMFQTAFNYPRPSIALYQIWELTGKPNYDSLNNLWKDEER